MTQCLLSVYLADSLAGSLVVFPKISNHPTPPFRVEKPIHEKMGKNSKGLTIHNTPFQSVSCCPSVTAYALSSHVHPWLVRDSFSVLKQFHNFTTFLDFKKKKEK